MHEESPSLVCNNVLPNPLDHSHVSPMCSQPCPSPEHYVDASIDNIVIWDATMDLGHKDNMFSLLGMLIINCP